MAIESDINKPIGYFESYLKTDFKADFEKYKKNIFGISGYNSDEEIFETNVNGIILKVPILDVYQASLIKNKIIPEIEKSKEFIQKIYFNDNSKDHWDATIFLNNKVVKKLSKLLAEFGKDNKDFGVNEVVYRELIGYLIDDFPDVSYRLHLKQTTSLSFPKKFEEVFDENFSFTTAKKHPRSILTILDDNDLGILKTALFEYYKNGIVSYSRKIKFNGISNNMLNNLLYIFNQNNPYKVIQRSELFDFLSQFIENYTPTDKFRFKQSMRTPFSRVHHLYIPDTVIKLFKQHGLVIF